MKRNFEKTLVFSAILALLFLGCRDTFHSPTDEVETNSVPVTDFSYREVAGGIEITSYLGSETSVTIPSQINGTPVVSIGGYAFR